MQLSGNRGWSSACELHKYATEAGIECFMNISEHFEDNYGSNKILIKFIHPPPNSILLNKALSELQSY